MLLMNVKVRRSVGDKRYRIKLRNTGRAYNRKGIFFCFGNAQVCTVRGGKYAKHLEE